MNRKIGVVLLALVAVMCLAFGACNLGTGTGLTKEETLQGYIFELDGQIVKEDFVLPRTIGDYRAIWTSSSENLVLEQRSEDYLAKVTIPETDEEVTLTVDLRGASRTYTVRLAAITARDFADSYNFKHNKGTVYESFELDQEALFNGRTATITWEVTDEASKNYIKVEDTMCVVTPSSLNPQVRIEATFTYKGETASTFYRFTVSEEMEHLQEVNYWYTNTGVSITMRGYVVSVAVEYSETYGNVSLYVMDENFDAGYYVYRVKCDAATAAKLVPGAYVVVEGTTNTNYNGLIETNAGGTITVDETKPPIDVRDYVKAIDNDILSGTPAAIYNQSRLVSLTNWKVESVNETAPKAGSTSTLFTLARDGKKVSVAVSKYLEGTYKPNADDAIWNALVAKYNEISAKLTAGEEVYVSVTGILGNYKGEQILPLSVDDIVYGTAPADDDTGKKVAEAISTVNSSFDLPALITSNTPIELPQDLDGVQASYRLIGERATFAIVDGKLVITPDFKEVATVQVTLTYGEYSTNLFYVITAENLDDAGKAAWEIQNLEVIEEILQDGTYDLPTTSFFEGASIVWTSNQSYATVNGTQLTVQLPLEAGVLKLTATVTVNGQTATGDFFVDVTAMSNTKIAYYEGGLKAGEYMLGLYQGNLGKDLYLTGVIADGSSIGFLASNEDQSKAATFVIEQVVENEVVVGYTIKADGKYIEAGKNSSGSIRVALVDAPTGYWVNYTDATATDGATVPVFELEGEKYFLNAYDTFETAGASKISYFNGAFVVKIVDGVANVTAQDILNTIVNETATVVGEDFALNTRATWSVKEGTAIVIDGYIAKVTAANEEQTVVLTATVTYAGETVSQDITITIPSNSPAPVAGEYRLAVNQVNLGKVLYAKAEISGDRYLVTTENPYEAAVLKITPAETGYYLTLDGLYVEVGNNANNKTAVLLLDAPTSTWQWLGSSKVMTFTFDGTEYYLGAYNTFNTISASKTSYITGDNASDVGVSQFVSEYTRPAPQNGNYTLKVNQVNTGKLLYATQINADTRFDTSVNVADAMVFTVTSVEGGYTIQVGTQYLVLDSAHHVALVDTYTQVWQWNDEAGVMYYNVSGTDYYLGTYSSWETISASKMTYILGDNLADIGVSQFTAQFEIATETTVTPGPDTPDPEPTTETVYDFVNNTEFSAWGSSYDEQTIGDVVIFSRANKQSTTITDRPVIATKNSAPENAGTVYVTVKETKNIASVKFMLQQWTSKTFDSITLEYYNATDDTWTNFATLATLSGDTEFSGTIPADVQTTIVRLAVTSSLAKNNQLGITSVTVTYATGTTEPGTPDPGPDTPDPEPTTVEKKTLAEFIALEDGETYYEISGTIVEIANTTYGNVYISDGETVVYLYGLASTTFTSNPKDFDTLGLEVGMNIVVHSQKSSYSNAPQGAGSGLISKTAAGDLDKVVLAVYTLSIEQQIVNTITLPVSTETGVTITWTSANTSVIAINGATVTVTPQATQTTVTLTATLTCGTATKTKSFDVVVAPAGTVAVNYTLIGTVDFSSTTNRTIFTTEQQAWVDGNNKVTLTNNKAASTSNVADYSAPARFYKSSSVTIAATGIRKIVFNANTANHAEALKNSITTGTVTVDGKVVTVVLDANVDKFEIASLAGQVRLDSVEVYTVA